MGIFERYVEGAQYKWNWYMCTLAGSMIPMALRFFISLDCGIAMFDVKDMLFAGLTMNLSNLNLMGRIKLKRKDRIAVMSGFLIVFIAAFLGLFYYEEDPEIRKDYVGLKIVAFIFVSVSVWVSYKANETAYNKSKK